MNQLHKRLHRAVLVFSILILLASSLFFVPNVQSHRPSRSQTPEFGTGILPIYPEGNLNLWYAWVNINDTRVVYLALYSDVHPSPIGNFLGQQYYTIGGSEVFVGHSYFLLEVFNDTNGNGVPDADYSINPPDSEIYYYLRVNASVTFQTSGITKYTVEGINHYNWSVTYQNIDAFLDPSDPYAMGALASLEYLCFAYDFSIQGNTTYLKTDFSIGNITILAGPPEITLEGLSLSTLYSTCLFSSTNLGVNVNNVPFDSRFADPLPQLAENSEIVTSTIRIYEMLFGYNYTWFQTEQGIELPSMTAACANTSLNELYPHWRVNVDLLNDALIAITSTIGLPSNLHIEPDNSPLLFRVCYPSWSGYPIQHDPTFKAYIQDQVILPPLLHPGIILVGIIGIVILVGSMISFRRTQQKTKAFSKKKETHQNFT